MATTRLVKSGFITAVLLLTSFISRAQLAANFTATQTAGCSPLVVSFIDQSTGNPTQWRWDLGNGTISFLRNPSVTYFNPGQYTVKLVIQNASGRDSITKTNYIVVYDQPAVDFSANNVTGCFPLAVQFSDLSTTINGSISQWQWDFGDGQTSTVQNPSHTYTASGNYNVSLRVVTNHGCSKTITKLQYIKIHSGVNADFTNSSPNTCLPPISVNFTNTSTGSGAMSYLWNFGDGNTSSDADPSHIYQTAGNFTVTLIVTSTNGCRDTLIRPNAINIGTVNTNFNFTTPACVNTPVAFTNTSTPAPASSMWDFGNGATSASISPAYAYPAAGTYQVKVINTYGNCSDSAFQTIIVLNKPTAAFSTTNTTSCKTPFEVSFSNESTSGNSYQWIFGDGSVSSDINPVHIYDSVGTFTVTLIVTNILGCTDTIVKSDYISIIPPVANVLTPPQEGCAPLTLSFNSSVNSIDPVASYLWDFGDGVTSTDEQPMHVFDEGIFNVHLTITTVSGCTDTTTMQGGVRAGHKPTPIFYADPVSACAYMPINFADSSLGMPDRWLWLFGDGSTSIMQHPSHHYQDTGWFTIKLYVWNNGCIDSLEVVDMIHIAPPIARFSVDMDCAQPLVRTFNDNSVAANAWHWDFGDGTTSTDSNAVHTYAGSGIYPVQLIVTNFETGCSDTATRNIQVADASANFNADHTELCRRSNVTFTAEGNTADILDYSWNFGDGNTAIGTPVTHTYINSGVYDVTLIITTVTGCKDTLTRPQYIHVNGPTAAFASAVSTSCKAQNVVFNDLSTTDGSNPITQWTWNFGDGITQNFTAAPFQHTYNASGSYAVTLTVTDALGCTDVITRSAAIIISSPNVGFRSADTITCANNNVRFINNSTGSNPLTYQWWFGDGGTSSLRNPVYAYPLDGIYTVKLKVTDRYGCSDSITKPNYVKVLSPVASFTASDTLGTCPPLVVNFTNTSINYTSLDWDFGDGTGSNVANPSHFYSQPGSYIARLTVRKLSCTSVYEKRIVVMGPSGSFVYSNILGCTPLTVSFTGTSIGRLSFIWDFSDGTAIPTTDSIISHTYTVPGTYLPRMILVDANGCVVPINGTDSIRVKGAMSDFTMDRNILCSPGSVAFTNASSATDPIVAYSWNFGDGGTSTVQNPVHSYTTMGMYNPYLAITSAFGCRDTLVAPNPVKVVNTPRGAITQSSNGCVPLLANFDGQILNPDTSALSWQWNLGNGHQANTQQHHGEIYDTAGDYTVSLIITNSNGCADTMSTSISAYRLPIASAGQDTSVCAGSSLQLQISGSDQHTWSPSAGLSCADCNNPVASPANTTTYHITATSDHGCTARDSIRIEVYQDFVMRASLADTICNGGRTQLFATGAANYRWEPATGLDNPAIANPVASPTQTTEYVVTGGDPHGCFTHTARIPIKVYPIPEIEAGEDVTINVGQVIDLLPRISPDVTDVTWSPTGSIFRNNFPAITVKPRQTTTYTVEAVNQGGCKSSDVVTVHVICNGANVFIPNTFSPNGDGTNDKFYPRGSGLFRIKSAKIFNRWGQIVFEKNDFNPNDERFGWDGSFKGQTVSSDVYVYIIEIICENNTVLPLKGNITVVK